jgi:hypothetical protein
MCDVSGVRFSKASTRRTHIPQSTRFGLKQPQRIRTLETELFITRLVPFPTPSSHREYPEAGYLCTFASCGSWAIIQSRPRWASPNPLKIASEIRFLLHRIRAFQRTHRLRLMGAPHILRSPIFFVVFQPL